MSKIFQCLVDIMDDVEAIGKNKTNSAQGYKFRGIDDMYNSLHPLFAKHGVFITSEVLNGDREERTTAKGGVLIYSIIDVRFTFYAVDGSNVSSVIKGEAMDSGDKATNKAISVALKYALMQMFMIPTDEKIDTEHESPEPMPKKEYAEDNRPWLSEKLLEKILERIRNGEHSVKEESIKAFRMKKEYKEKIQSA